MQPQPQQTHQEQVSQFVTQEVIKELETQRNMAHSRCAQLAQELANAKVAMTMAHQQIEKLTAELKRFQEEKLAQKTNPIGVAPEGGSPQPGESGGTD